MNWINLQAVLAPPMLVLMVALPAIAVLTARLSRPDLFFAITVMPALRESAAGQAILRQFSLAVILSTLLGLALTLPGLFAGLTPALGLPLTLGGGVVEFGGIALAYGTARRRVRPHRVEPSREREVMVKPRPSRPVGGWLGQAGPFLVLGVAVLALWWRWDAIPNRFPIHWDLYGRPNGWASKSWGSVFGTALAGALCCLFLSLMMNGFARGVRRIHSSGVDAEKESRFLRTMLLMVLGLEYCLAALFGFTPILPGWLTTILVAAALLLSLGLAVVGFRSGQGGWRLRGRTPTPMPRSKAPVGDRTPDDCWKGGLIYYNPADPAVWVEKRFGIGWTLNFGNARAWLILGGILLFAAALVLVSILMTRQ